MKISLARRTVAEFFGTAFLVAAVIGSGIMADRLSGAKSGSRFWRTPSLRQPRWSR
jgi:glycerol uptake facilitator-like aquaporin